MKHLGIYGAARLAAALLLLSPAAAVFAEDFAQAQAEKACVDEDLPTLFNAMAVSDPVMRQYLAKSVTLSDAEGVLSVHFNEYDALPIAMLDYSYVTRRSFEAWQKDAAAPLDYVSVEFNQSQDNRWRLDWAQLSGPPNEGGEASEQPQPTGRAGYLLFFPTQSCWELVQDHLESAG
jgi:hypothetical protein